MLLNGGAGDGSQELGLPQKASGVYLGSFIKDAGERQPRRIRGVASSLEGKVPPPQNCSFSVGRTDNSVKVYDHNTKNLEQPMKLVGNIFRTKSSYFSRYNPLRESATARCINRY